MKTNPVVDNVRKARKEISQKYGNDLKKLASYYQKMERSLDYRMRGEKLLRKAV